MEKVYMFSYETMCLDLLKNNVKEDIEELAEEILGELRLSNIIEIDDTFIIGSITSFLIKEKFGIECAAMELI